MIHINKLKAAGFVLMFGLMFCFAAAKGGVKAINSNITDNSPAHALIVLAIDRSPSFSGYRKVDTAYVGSICRKLAMSGGTLVTYAIGNPSDRSGLRLKLKRLPVMDHSLLLSKQLALRKEMDELKAYNAVAIRNYLMEVQEQILGPPSEKVKGTDINGVLKKLDVLMSEPEYAACDRIALVYSDGIQSLNGKTSPAHYDYKQHNLFKMYLCGWKTAMPTKSVTITQFEDVSGFSDYLDTVNSIKHN